MNKTGEGYGMGKPEEMLTLKDAAKLIGVSPSTLHRWAVKEGRVRYFAIGPYRRVLRFRRDDVLALVEERGGKQPSEHADGEEPK